MLRVVANKADLVEDQILGAEINGTRLALYLVAGTIFATADECTHMGCSLAENGSIEGNEVECMCHGSRFSIPTGENVGPPARLPLSAFQAVVDGDDVLIDVD
jgi:nitrite reductase/ring-hydroxylating ferredoxin subunit